MRSGPALRLALLVAAPLVFFLIPSAAIDHGPTLCLFKATISWTCPGCGMTRALYRMLHGDFAAAVALNRLVIVTAPLLAGIWFAGVLREVRLLAARRVARVAAE